MSGFALGVCNGRLLTPAHFALSGLVQIVCGRKASSVNELSWCAFYSLLRLNVINAD